MPPGIPFHSPLLYTQQQLQQILANLEKIVFLKVGHQVYRSASVGDLTCTINNCDVLFDISLSLSLHTHTHTLTQEVSDLADVEISADSVASLVTSGHDLHIGAEEETSHTQ